MAAAVSERVLQRAVFLEVLSVQPWSSTSAMAARVE